METIETQEMSSSPVFNFSVAIGTITGIFQEVRGIGPETATGSRYDQEVLLNKGVFKNDEVFAKWVNEATGNMSHPPMGGTVIITMQNPAGHGIVRWVLADATFSELQLPTDWKNIPIININRLLLSCASITQLPPAVQ